jgi:hypothetical protein
MKELERAAGSGRGLAAFKSLAESRHVPLYQVVEAAERGDLVSIVDKHDHGAEARIEERNMARRLALLRGELLAAKMATAP